MEVKVMQISRFDKENDVIRAIASTSSCHFFMQIYEPLYGKPWKYIGIKCKSVKELIKIKPDVLIIHNYQGLPFGLLLLLISKLLGIKTIMQFECDNTMFPRKIFPLKQLFIKVLRFPFIVLTAKIADRLQVFTQWEVDILSKFVDESKTWIIPYGMDFEIGTMEKDNFILSVARWDDRKNLHMIIQTFKKVVELKKDINLVASGSFRNEKYRDYIKRLVAELGLNGKIEFLGFVSDEKIRELYKKAKIFYLPSKMETFGRVYVEAMASGTPIVAMKISAVQYVVKDGVTGFLRNTEDEQKEAILKLLTDEKLYREMQKNCLKEAERYKWENVTKEWEKLIEELVEGEE